MTIMMENKKNEKTLSTDNDATYNFGLRHGGRLALVSGTQPEWNFGGNGNKTFMVRGWTCCVMDLSPWRGFQRGSSERW